MFQEAFFSLSCSVKILQELFNKAMEKVNMDAVFLEDSIAPVPAIAPAGHAPTPDPLPPPSSSVQEGGGARGGAEEQGCISVSSHTHTTAYIFVWMLMIEAVRQCNPEVCLCVCTFVCVYVCVCVCMCVYLCCVCLCVCMFVCVYVCLRQSDSATLRYVCVCMHV